MDSLTTMGLVGVGFLLILIACAEVQARIHVWRNTRQHDLCQRTDAENPFHARSDG